MAFIPDSGSRFVPDKRNARTIDDPIQRAALDPTAGMSSGDVFLAGAGKTLTDLGQGFMQRIGAGPSAKEVDIRRDRDVPLMARPEGFLGSLSGGVAATLPTAALGAGTIPLMIAGGTYGALQPTGEGESAALNTAMGAATAGLLKYGLDKGVPLLSNVTRRTMDKFASANARAQELNRVLSEGRKLGLTVPPSTTRPTITNRALETIGGKIATKQGASLKNQDVVYQAAQRYAGLPKNQALSEGALAQARNAAAKPYREIAALSDDAASALERWRQANFEKNLQWNYFNRSGDPAAYKAASAADDAADAALDAIEAEAKKVLSGPGAKQMIDALKAARRQIAKIHTVESSMRGSAVDPAALAKASGKKPLEGELKTISEFAKNFPKAMERPQLQGSGGVNQLMSTLMTGFGGTAGGAVGGPAGAGVGAAMGYGAAQTIPPAVRSLILSKPYQAAMTKVPMNTAAMENLIRLLNTPETRGLLAGGGAMYAAGK